MIKLQHQCLRVRLSSVLQFSQICFENYQHPAHLEWEAYVFHCSRRVFERQGEPSNEENHLVHISKFLSIVDSFKQCTQNNNDKMKTIEQKLFTIFGAHFSHS